MRRSKILLGAAIGLLGLAACGKPDREPEVPEPIAEPAATQDEMAPAQTTEQTPATEQPPSTGQAPTTGQGPATGQQPSTDQGQHGMTGQTAGYPSSVSAPVMQYRDWASSELNNRMTPSVESTADGISRLVAALRALQNAEPGAAAIPQDKIDDLTKKADRLKSSPKTSAMRADQARDALMAAVEVMEEMQRRRFPGDPDLQAGVAKVRQAVMSLEPQKKLADQGEKVETIFEETIKPMEMMGRLPKTAQP